MIDHTRRRPALLISGIVIALLGLILAAGGVWLMSLSGSWYYALVGVGIVLTGILLVMRRPAALWLYALIVIGTLVWAIAETGFDWWPLAARGDIIFLIGIYLLMPWITRGFVRRPAERPPAAWRGAGIPLALSLAIAGVIGLYSMFQNYHDVTGTIARSTTAPSDNVAGVANADWPATSRTWNGNKYAPLTQITPDNANKLAVAWTYHTGDMKGQNDPVETTYELTPIKVGNTVYICTPHDWVVALDAVTGKEVWKYVPKLDQKINLQHLTCRGVSYHSAAAYGLPAPADCPDRVVVPTADARLIALDAATGKPCQSFGNNGAVDLWPGMADPVKHAGMYYSTSPPVITRNLVIVAGEVTDDYSTDEPSGVIRGYDINSGRLVWNFDPGNPDQTMPIGPGQSYTKNSPNSWSISSADEALGMVYLPMGNETPDQFGGHRGPNTEKFASSVLALDIATGKLRWVYQTVHHDLWDMDVPAQPNLVDIDGPNGKVPALVQPTKRGDLYVLDRRTGTPIIPAPERTVPQGAAEGDRTAATQPFSDLTLLTPPLTERDMWGATMFDQLACRIAFRSLRYDGIFTPPSVKGTLVFPGNFGIIDWGGIAIDPIRQIAFANPSYFAFTSRLIPRPAGAAGNSAGGPSNEGGGNPMLGTPYAVDMNPFRSAIGLPCQAPPWGFIAGIDLKSGKLVYKIKNGTTRDVAPVPVPFPMGVPSLGGPIVTAGGVAFLTSTIDYYIRAYDVTDGRTLWQDRLPAGGQATPMSYQGADGRQYVVAVAGGHGSLGTKLGDSVIAYALPK